MEPVLFEQKNNIAWLTLNRPKTRNALSLELIENMQNKLNEIAQNKEIRVLIIRGNGPGFCAGHNLNELTGSNCDIHQIRQLFSVCTKMMETIHTIPQPVIAQVHGIATAAGCQLVAACDLAIAEHGARFAVPGIKLGLFCSTPMVPLSRVIGRRRALEMLLSGRYISAQEAQNFGLVNKIVTSEQLDNAAQEWAETLAQYSLFTLGFGKQAFYKQIDLDESSAYDYAKEAISINCLAHDAQEGINAFLEKRKPEWKNK